MCISASKEVVPVASQCIRNEMVLPLTAFKLRHHAVVTTAAVAQEMRKALGHCSRCARRDTSSTPVFKLWDTCSHFPGRCQMACMSVKQLVAQSELLEAPLQAAQATAAAELHLRSWYRFASRCQRYTIAMSCWRQIAR